MKKSKFSEEKMPTSRGKLKSEEQPLMYAENMM
jgi:hypothetical protein